MPAVSMKIRLDTSPEEFLGRLRDSLSEDALKAAKVVVDAPYAEAVEFGTGPADPSISSPKTMRTFKNGKGGTFNKPVTDVFYKFYEWCVMRSMSDPYNAAKAIYRDRMEHGSPPRPYVRPALHEVEDNFQDIFETEKSLYGVAVVLAEGIKDNLRTGGESAETASGALEASIHVEYCDGTEHDDGHIPESAWESDTCDFNGAERI